MSERDMFYKDDATERTYVLKCRPAIFKVWVEDAGRKYQSTILLLVPEVNDQCVQFFNAWLPEDAQTHFELGAFIHPPIASPARLSVHRRNERSPNHHLTVMSRGVAEEIEKFAMNKVLTVDILPASQELASLDSKETSGDYTKVKELYE